MTDYQGPSPYYNFREYRVRYGRGYRGEEHRNIGEKHDDRERRDGRDNYRDRENERGHDQGDNDDQGHGGGNGHGRGHGKGHQDGHDD